MNGFRFDFGSSLDVLAAVVKYKEEWPVLRILGDQLTNSSFESGLVYDFAVSKIVSLTKGKC